MQRFFPAKEIKNVFSSRLLFLCLFQVLVRLGDKLIYKAIKRLGQWRRTYVASKLSGFFVYKLFLVKTWSTQPQTSHLILNADNISDNIHSMNDAGWDLLGMVKTKWFNQEKGDSSRMPINMTKAHAWMLQGITQLQEQENLPIFFGCKDILSS